MFMRSGLCIHFFFFDKAWHWIERTSERDLWKKNVSKHIYTYQSQMWQPYGLHDVLHELVLSVVQPIHRASHVHSNAIDVPSMHTTLRLLTMAKNSMQSTLQPRYTCESGDTDREKKKEWKKKVKCQWWCINYQNKYCSAVWTSYKFYS